MLSAKHVTQNVTSYAVHSHSGCYQGGLTLSEVQSGVSHRTAACLLFLLVCVAHVGHIQYTAYASTDFAQHLIGCPTLVSGIGCWYDHSIADALGLEKLMCQNAFQ